jgi:hypothetical protein
LHGFGGVLVGGEDSGGALGFGSSFSRSRVREEGAGGGRSRVHGSWLAPRLLRQKKQAGIPLPGVLTCCEWRGCTDRNAGWGGSREAPDPPKVGRSEGQPFVAGATKGCTRIPRCSVVVAGSTFDLQEGGSGGNNGSAPIGQTRGNGSATPCLFA